MLPPQLSVPFARDSKQNGTAPQLDLSAGTAPRTGLLRRFDEFTLRTFNPGIAQPVAPAPRTDR